MAKLQRRLGRVVRRLRSQAGFSQEGFAAHVRVHRTTMGRLENGRFNLTLETLERLARALGLSASALLAEAEREGQRARPQAAVGDLTEGAAAGTTSDRRDES